MDIEMEIRALKDENQMLKCRYKEADTAKVAAEKELSDAADVVKELQSRINFLMGQIEAYQYCINNRR